MGMHLVTMPGESAGLPLLPCALMASTIACALLVGGCESVPAGAGNDAVAERPAIESRDADAKREALAELIHRYVLTNPLLDDCVEEWGGGRKGGVQIDFWAMPTGELRMVDVVGGEEALRACADDALRQIRLPSGSVGQAKMVSISIR